MANRRMIIKADLENPKWLRLTARQRYLYWAMTLHADDDGILPYYWINGRIFFANDEVTAEDLDQDLSDLSVSGYIEVYGADGDDYILIRRWWDKQFIDKKLYKSTQFPKPPTYFCRPYNLTKKLNTPFYDDSGNPLDQNNVSKSKKVEDSLSEIKKDQRFSHDDDLPFD